jgi:hypothetical protein
MLTNESELPQQSHVSAQHKGENLALQRVYPGTVVVQQGSLTIIQTASRRILRFCLAEPVDRQMLIHLFA